MGSNCAVRFTAVAVTVIAGVSLTLGCSSSTPARQGTVAERGARVMPFDLDATTHTFTDARDGGIERVTADEPSDAKQIRLIRGHLRREAKRFSRGDFADPARVHGMNMPGVDELRKNYDRVNVAYAAQPSGAQITYTTVDPKLVAAIHRWFDRQLADHGDDAQRG